MRLIKKVLIVITFFTALPHLIEVSTQPVHTELVADIKNTAAND